MKIKVCVSGVTGWTGSLIAKKILSSDAFELVAAIARSAEGKDVAEALSLPEKTGVMVCRSLGQALETPFDVLVDFTSPESVKERALMAIHHQRRVVIGTSGLTAVDYEEIGRDADKMNIGVFAAGNFSITAALAAHFSEIAAKYLPTWEIIDYASAGKKDVPSGTVQELAERLASVKKNDIRLPVNQLHGPQEARGANIQGTQVHSVRLPGYVISFETLFGLPDERLTIRHDAGTGAEPYVGGTLLAIEKVMQLNGLVRGLDKLLFSEN